MIFERSLEKYKNKSKSVLETNISPGSTATLRNSTKLRKELARETLSHSFWKHLRVRSSVFKNEVPEKRVPKPIVRQQPGVCSRMQRAH